MLVVGGHDTERVILAVPHRGGLAPVEAPRPEPRGVATGRLPRSAVGELAAVRERGLGQEHAGAGAGEAARPHPDRVATGEIPGLVEAVDRHVGEERVGGCRPPTVDRDRLVEVSRDQPEPAEVAALHNGTQGAHPRMEAVVLHRRVPASEPPALLDDGDRVRERRPHRLLPGHGGCGRDGDVAGVSRRGHGPQPCPWAALVTATWDRGTPRRSGPPLPPHVCGWRADGRSAAGIDPLRRGARRLAPPRPQPRPSDARGPVPSSGDGTHARTYSTVTVLARFRGLSTSRPRLVAIA